MVKTYVLNKQGIHEDVSIADWRRLDEEERVLLWVDVRQPSEEEMRGLAEEFGLHSLAVESCMDSYRRPHLYEFEDHFYVNLTSIHNRKNGHRGVKPDELHLFASEKWVITVTHRDTDAVDATLGEYKDTPALCERGSMYAVYLLIEDLIETYYPVVESLDDEADSLETAMLQNADRQSLSKLFDLKRTGFELRKLFGPQRDVLTELSRRDFPFITGENQVYFQDLYNRMIRLFDMMDTIREILSGNLDIYLSMVSNRLNEIMKVLTVAATILMLLSFVTGFFGMNFVHLPWLRSPNAFRNMMIAMAIVTLAMLWWFKRKHWM